MIYHTELFDRLAAEKRQTILQTAAAEFSRYGYKTANINIIAEKCGVSVGSLYKYFKTKENLFLAVCSDAVRQLSSSFEEVERDGGDFFHKVERILRIILAHSRQHGDLINLYNEITTEANKDLAVSLSYQMESLSAEYYRDLILQGQEQGFLRKDLDPGLGAFCLDNLFMSLQFSYASEYYKERMRIYVSPDVFEDDEKVVAGCLRFIKNALISR